MNANPGLSRRTLLLAGLGAVAATGLGNTPVLAQSANTIAAGTDNSAPADDAGFDDGLAVPFYSKSFAAGKPRAIVLGGGGEFFAAWMLGYLKSLSAGGADLSLADAIVGTSAGSLVGATVAGGHLTRVHKEFDLLGEFPKLMQKLIPTAKRNPSQVRATRVAASLNTADPAAIQSLGRVAMAARNMGTEQQQEVIRVITGEGNWPAPSLHTTANDCYTGQRLVVTEAAGIPVKEAIGASMSVPGAFGPTWLGWRLCMDGGMCETSTHCDLVMGVERALVISLTDGRPGGDRLSSMPNTIQDEIANLRKAGAEVFFVSVNPKPGTNLLDPTLIGSAMQAGRTRGAADAPDFKKFWS